MTGSRRTRSSRTRRLLIHEVSHLLRDHEARKKAAGITDHRRWNTAGDCEINDDLHAEGLPLPGDPPLPGKYGLQSGNNAEIYYNQLPAPPRADETRAGDGAAVVAGLRVGRARRTAILGAAGRRWSRAEGAGCRTGSRPSSCGARWRGASTRISPLRRRRPLRLAALGPRDARAEGRLHGDASVTRCGEPCATARSAGYDRTYRRPHRRQACYGEFIMASFYQPRPRPGSLIDTSGSMEDSQLARAVAELGGLTRQLGYGADVVVACCDAAVHDVRKVFSSAQVELYGGGGTDIGVGLRAFIERKSRADRPAGHRQRLPHAVAEERFRRFRSSRSASATAHRRPGAIAAPTE